MAVILAAIGLLGLAALALAAADGLPAKELPAGRAARAAEREAPASERMAAFIERRMATPAARGAREGVEAPTPATGKDVMALARMLWGEARGVSTRMEQAACVWCALNRVDDPRWPDTVAEVLVQPGQFAGYDEAHPLRADLVALAADVLARWRAEKAGLDDVGRVLPKEYCFFSGDGERNRFTNSWGTEAAAWDFRCPDPYDGEAGA